MHIIIAFRALGAGVNTKSEVAVVSPMAIINYAQVHNCLKEARRIMGKRSTFKKKKKKKVRN